MPEENNIKNNAAEFLLAEFSALQARAIAKEEVRANRINFFLVVVAAIITGTSIFFEVRQTQLSSNFQILIVLASLVILIFGITTLEQVVKYSVEIVFFYRVAGRIRRYFVDTYEEIYPYIAFEATDSRPRIDIGYSSIALRGGDAILIGINALASAMLASLATSVVFNSTSYLFYSSIGVLTFILSWVLQVIRIRTILIKAEKVFEKRIRFPQSICEDQEPKLNVTSNEMSAT